MSLFDTTNATASGIPNGEYLATVVGGEVKTTKNGDGSYINLKFKLDNGSTLYQMYNIANKSQVAVNLGLSHLKDLQVASGKTAGPVNSIEELFGLRCKIAVKNKTDSFGEKANIVKYLPITKAEELSPF